MSLINVMDMCESLAVDFSSFFSNLKEIVFYEDDVPDSTASFISENAIEITLGPEFSGHQNLIEATALALIFCHELVHVLYDHDIVIEDDSSEIVNQSRETWADYYAPVIFLALLNYGTSTKQLAIFPGEKKHLHNLLGESILHLAVNYFDKSTSPNFPSADDRKENYVAGINSFYSRTDKYWSVLKAMENQTEIYGQNLLEYTSDRLKKNGCVPAIKKNLLDSIKKVHLLLQNRENRDNSIMASMKPEYQKLLDPKFI